MFRHDSDWRQGKGSGPGGQAVKGTMVGRVFLGLYQAVQPLGAGSMGRVYLARQRTTGRLVVIKVMHEEVAAQPLFRELFEREMDCMSRFKHPYAVALLDASLTDAHGPCLVLEHVRGVDLERLLRRHRRFSPERAGRWLGQLCEVLQAAHAQGILHHDLKPANVMIVDPDTPLERIKVMDFGLAKLAASPHLRLEQLRRTAAAAVATGTVEYLPPEQARGDTPDHRGDLYSVGVMLFELLTGRLPFARPGVAETLQAHAHEPPPAFADVGAAGWVAPAVEAVVRTCLAKYPVERPQSAWELAQRYEQALGRKVLAADGPAPAGPPPKPRTDLKSGRKLDLNSLSYELDAVMPEPMAAAKLRGFVEDVGGEVVASEPGLVRVLLGGGRCAYQLAAAPPRGPAGLGRLVGGSRPVLIEMELHMVKPDPAQPDRLHLTVLLRPLGGAAPVPAAQWRACADRIHADLRAYLMS